MSLLCTGQKCKYISKFACRRARKPDNTEPQPIRNHIWVHLSEEWRRKVNIVVCLHESLVIDTSLLVMSPLILSFTVRLNTECSLRSDLSVLACKKVNLRRQPVPETDSHLVTSQDLPYKVVTLI